MTLKNIIPKEEHILEAQQIAERIFKNKPQVQLEMLEEVKQHLIKLTNNSADRLERV